MSERFNFYDGESHKLKAVISKHFGRILDDMEEIGLYGVFTKLHSGEIDTFIITERHALCRLTRDTTDSVIMLNVGDYVKFGNGNFTEEEEYLLTPLNGW